LGEYIALRIVVVLSVGFGDDPQQIHHEPLVSGAVGGVWREKAKSAVQQYRRVGVPGTEGMREGGETIVDQKSLRANCHVVSPLGPGKVFTDGVGRNYPRKSSGARSSPGTPHRSIYISQGCIAGGD